MPKNISIQSFPSFEELKRPDAIIFQDRSVQMVLFLLLRKHIKNQCWCSEQMNFFLHTDLENACALGLAQKAGKDRYKVSAKAREIFLEYYNKTPNGK